MAPDKGACCHLLPSIQLELACWPPAVPCVLAGTDPKPEPALLLSHRPSSPGAHLAKRAAAFFGHVQALIHGLNRHYYSLAINYRKTPLEERMLGNLQASAGCNVGCGGWAKHDAPAGQRRGANGGCACWAVCRRVLHCLACCCGRLPGTRPPKLPVKC